MKKHLFICLLILLCVTPQCGVTHNRKKATYLWEVEIVKSEILSFAHYHLRTRTEFDTDIYIDTNLVFRENMHSNSKPIFHRIPVACTPEAEELLRKKRGTYTLPDSLKGKIHVIRDSIDFDRDSFEYILASMPAYMKKEKLYIYQLYCANQNPFNRDLSCTNYCFDRAGKSVRCPCNQKINKENRFTSNYWTPILQPRRCGLECQDRRNRVYRAHGLDTVPTARDYKE
jgi:hypothetical protein